MTETLLPATDHPLLDGLNEPQRAAVVHAGAPLLVVAGAGSGKTRVLTRRIAWLISQRQAHPGSILAITFTNKAAAEMKERVEELVGKRARLMWVSTFHSACVRILRKEIDRFGYKSSFSIYDAQDQKRLMQLVATDLDLDPRQYQPGALLHWVSNQKNELKDPEEATREAHNKLEETFAAARSGGPAAAAGAFLRRVSGDAAWEALSPLAEVHIVAPATQQSAVGRSISIFEPIRAHEVELQGARGIAVAGKPTDARILMLLDRRADLHLARRSAADAWLVKPLDPLALKRAVRDLLHPPAPATEAAPADEAAPAAEEEVAAAG